MVNLLTQFDWFMLAAEVETAGWLLSVFFALLVVGALAVGATVVSALGFLTVGT